MADEVASPCTGVCRLDDSGELCVGCWRTLDEIACWSRFSAAERRRVLEDAAMRGQVQAIEPR